MCEEISIHGQLFWLCVQKILSADSKLHYLWNICLIQLIRWLHLIFKAKKEKHDWIALQFGWPIDWFTPFLSVSWNNWTFFLLTLYADLLLPTHQENVSLWLLEKISVLTWCMKSTPFWLIRKRFYNCCLWEIFF